MVDQLAVAADQLLIQPGRTDGAHLLLEGQRRAQLDGDVAQGAGIMLPTSLWKVGRHPPDALGQPLDDTGPAQGFQAPNMALDQCLRILPVARLRARQGQMMIGAIQAIRSQRSNRPIYRARLAQAARFHHATDGVVGQFRTGRLRQVVGLAVESVDYQIAAVV